ncbi:hypothetical protein CKW48_21410, partial [Bordetella pertussis]
LRRLQQLTPPLAAKALEDTWFYRDGTLLSRNEVLALDGRMADAPHRLALRRLQQLTPPLAAKALEDTWFYRDGTLLSRNEV